MSAPTDALVERACGSKRWRALVSAAGPFDDHKALMAASEAAFDALDEADWLEAFAHHPRIGDVSRLRERFASSGDLSQKEQGDAVRAAAEATIQQLFELNLAYELRHGHIFIVCATGKTAAEMLALLEARIGRDPTDEISTCAEEQRKITRLRLTPASPL